MVSSVSPDDRSIDVTSLEEPPYACIVDALGPLETPETVEIICSSFPSSLFPVLDERGLEYETKRPASGDWHVVIHPVSADGGWRTHRQTDSR